MTTARVWVFGLGLAVLAAACSKGGSGGATGAMVMYNSGAAATYILAVGGKKLQFAMPANGWATVDYVP